jgi:membrane peptidoglycan carboxypeptidase
MHFTNSKLALLRTCRHKQISWWVLLLLCILFLLFFCWVTATNALTKYHDQLSVVVYDRNSFPLSIKENSRGHYVLPLTEVPPSFGELLIKKEDRFFFYHPGINLFSTLRAIVSYMTKGETGGSSTISQQLAKNLLETESDRTLANKIKEAFYALSLEIFTTKEDILLMYSNTAFLGNQIQGFETASHAYFDKSLSELTHNEQLSLLTTLSHPSTRNPWQEENATYASDLHERISPEEIFLAPSVTTAYSFQTDTYFELRTAGVSCTQSCWTTVDDTLTRALRNILDRHITEGWSKQIRNGAIVVIDPNNAELLALIGSRDPQSQRTGNQINMAITPRPIGSTIKPFLYAKGFAEGLRPYTLVDDREYKYPIATGYPLYPKNYDGQYRGEITLHEALSNSLNVPSVKVLEYIGLENFYSFLSNDLSFQPIQDYDQYQYGIALGGLEMDLLTLTHYYTLFPEQGSLKPLLILAGSKENFDLPSQSSLTTETRVLEQKYIELVHAILSDRFTGVNQFGLKGNLTLTTTEYGVKTGTSRDFHDSWVVGYTPDLVVGVWIGNSENEALDQVSGSVGAGAVWHDVMEYLLASPYHHQQSFSSSHLELFTLDTGMEWGLKDDTPDNHKDLLISDTLIHTPHNGDRFELTDTTTIPLVASKEVSWEINGQSYSKGREVTFHPDALGTYDITASDETLHRRETISITFTEPE